MSFAKSTLKHQYGSGAALHTLASLLRHYAAVAMEALDVAATVFDMAVGHSLFVDTMTGA